MPLAKPPRFPLRCFPPPPLPKQPFPNWPTGFRHRKPPSLDSLRLLFRRRRNTTPPHPPSRLSIVVVPSPPAPPVFPLLNSSGPKTEWGKSGINTRKATVINVEFPLLPSLFKSAERFPPTRPTILLPRLPKGSNIPLVPWGIFSQINPPILRLWHLKLDPQFLPMRKSPV